MWGLLLTHSTEVVMSCVRSLCNNTLMGTDAVSVYTKKNDSLENIVIMMMNKSGNMEFCLFILTQMEATLKV